MRFPLLTANILCVMVGATIGPLIMTSVLMADRPWQWGAV
jgi:hypothetical protein